MRLLVGQTIFMYGNAMIHCELEWISPLVLVTGLEPVQQLLLEPKSNVSTNSSHTSIF